MPRHRSITPDVETEIIAGIASGLTKGDAAIAAGVSHTTLNRHEKRSAEFAQRLTRASKQRTRTWLSQLWRNAQAGDTRAITELIDRCDSDYRKTTQVSVSHTGTITHEHITPEQRAIAERIAATRGLDVEDVLAEAVAVLQGAD